MKHSERLKAFEEVRKRHGTFLESVIWKLTGSRELFSEAMQNSLLSVWRNVEKLGGDGAGRYLYRLALSSASKAWRGRLAKGKNLSEIPEVSGESPEKDAAEKEQIRGIRRAISGLPRMQATALAMRYFENKDYEAIAGELGCSAATARSHVSKALASLRKMFGAPEEKET